MRRHRSGLCFGFAVLLALTCSIFPSPPAAAGTLVEEIRFDRQDLTFRTVGEYDVVTLRGADFTSEVGAPCLPAKTIHILLPPSSRLSGVQVVDVEREVLGGSYRIRPCQPPVPVGAEQLPAFVGPSAVYETDRPYPAAEAALVSENRFVGFRLASVTVHPLTYRPASGEVTLNRSIRLAVSYEPSAGTEPRKRISLRAARETETVIGALVRNPRMMDSYRDQAFATVDTTVARPLRLEVSLSTEDGEISEEAGPLEYLIVTGADLADEFQPLADWKTKKGIPAAVVTIEWIESNYPLGCDLQETIRNFLIEVKSQHPSLAYVLIGGDVDVVPVRGTGVISYSTDPSPIPTDLYYGDIDPPTNWNSDGDAVIGEETDGQDAVPDLYVGRAPVNTPEQAVTFVTKTLFWEREMPADHSERVLMMGGSNSELNPEGIGAVNKEAIGADFLPPNIFAHYLCYPRAGSSYLGTWDCDEELTTQTAIARLNEGYLFVNHQNHSNIYELGVGEGGLDRSSVDALSNGPLQSALFTLGCSAGAFDYDCVIEHFVRNPGGGGPMAVGSSRTAWWPQNSQDRAFVEALYVTGLNFGQAAAMTKTADFYLTYRYLLNTLGDPELPYFTKTPGSLALSRPSSVELGEPSITVGVFDMGSSLPVEGALVCAMKGLKGAEDYAVGITGPSGWVTFDFDADTPGTIELTVTHRNYSPAESTIGVVAGDEPFVYLYGWSVDDDTLGTSSGNGDHLADAGETIEVPVSLHNVGTETAKNVRAKLSLVSPSPYVTILDGTEDFRDILPGRIVTSPDDFDIAISPDCPEGHAVEMKVTITAKIPVVKPSLVEASVPGGSTLFDSSASQLDDSGDDILRVTLQYSWIETFTIPVQGPDLRVVSHSVDDASGDDVIQPNEQVELPVTVKNFGRGIAGAVTGVLTSSSPYVTMLNGSASFGDVTYLEEAASTTPFVFSTTIWYTMTPLPFELVLRDQYDHEWTVPIEVFLAPAAPTGLAGVAGTEDILLTWSPSSASNLAGYHVYRADQADGPFVRLDREMIDGSSRFQDTGLAGSTYYYYAVTAVNTSGRESAFSSVLPVQTTLPNQDGWPVCNCGQVSSPLITDLDENGNPELLFGGSTRIFAFHYTGEEVLDIDMNPTTISGFASAVGTVGTPSAADLDGDGFQEIVAVANDSVSHRVYAWRSFDGPDADREADLVGGFPVSTPDRVGAVSVPALGDVDGDGDLEIFVGGDQSFYGWHHDGTAIVANSNGVFLAGGLYIYGTAALADLNGNGTADVIIGGGSDGTLYAVDGTASPLPGWPVYLGSWITSSPAVGDLDRDGIPEIVVADMAGNVHVRRADGTAFGHSWPAFKPQGEIYAVVSSVSLSDLDGDGYLEVVAGNSDKKVYAWHWDGTPVAGWPTAATDKTIHSSPAIGDLDGDGVMEVAVATTGGLAYAWNLAGEVVPGWPIPVGGLGSSPAIVDLDQDGDVDVAVGSWGGCMFVWDCDGRYDPGSVGWGQFHHDPARTGKHP